MIIRISFGVGRIIKHQPNHKGSTMDSVKKLKWDCKKDIPLLADADIAVIGGGPGGLGAAVMAAREGARVVLVERYGFPGGMAASGGVTPFMHNHVVKPPPLACLDTPICREWQDRINSYRTPPSDTNLPLTRELASLAAEDMLLDAKVNLLYHHTLVDVIRDENTIRQAVLHSKSGFSAVGAKVFIDSTGDGDLAALANCPFEKGDSEGLCQPMTLFFQLSHLEPERMPDDTELNRLYRLAKERGEISCPQGHFRGSPQFDPTVFAFNWTRVLDRDGLSGTDLSMAEIEARRQVREVVSWLRREVPGYGNAQIHSIACQIGIRETRRILGKDYLTRAAFEERRKCADGIARVNYPIDIHNPKGAGVELIDIPWGDYYEIPFGCLVPRGCGNLLIGSRCISVDHAIHASIRIMPVVCSLGSTAGIAAAWCARDGITPSAIDGREIRASLKRHGAFL